nr:hypothetical protein GCM10020092_052580 [Actinoplanes digitatis]
MTRRPIIVGTDGTDSSLSAVRWAAAEAERRELPLRIVYAYDGDSQEWIDVARLTADAVLAFADDRARETAPNAAISTEALAGPAVPRLLDLARGAELLVLGSRGRGGVAGLLLGSVSQRMATRAACPVVVVRGRATPDGPVVAGVDDTPRRRRSAPGGGVRGGDRPQPAAHRHALAAAARPAVAHRRAARRRDHLPRAGRRRAGPARPAAGAVA